MLLAYKHYLWGFLYKGSSYYEFRFPRGWTLMVPIRGANAGVFPHWMREFGWGK